jgi:hypothetical protein
VERRGRVFSPDFIAGSELAAAKTGGDLPTRLQLCGEAV